MNFARSLFTVSGLTVLSRIGGFVRDTLIAMFLGAGPVADAFFVAQRLPNLFRSLFAEGAFSAAFVPLYTIEQERHGTKTAQKFSGEALAVLLAALIPFSVLIMIFMPEVTMILAPGFEKDPFKYDLTVDFSLITFPYLTLISITALQGGVLNARNIFGPAAAAPIAFNLVMIAGLFFAKYMNMHVGYVLSWSMEVAGLVQMAWLVISCWRSGVPIPLVWPRLTQSTRRLFRRVGPGALGAGASQVNLLVSTVLASTLPTGGVSWLFYADRLNQLPLGIVGIAVATTLLPMLSRHVEAGREDQVRHYTSRAIEFSLMLGLPATVGLTVSSHPIIQTLFQHGAFSATDTTETARALAAYALGVPAVLLVKVYSAGFFARHDTATPVKIAFIAMIVNVGSSLLMLHFMQHVGIALANSFAVWTNTILLYAVLRRQRGKQGDKKLMQRVPKICICAVTMCFVTWGLMAATEGFFKEGTGLIVELTGLSLVIGGSLVAYAITLQVSGAMRVQDLLRVLKRDAMDEAVETDPTSNS